MKKIAYIELDTHAEIAQNFFELMYDSQLFQVDYYFSHKIAGILQNRDANIFVVEPYELFSKLQNNNYDLIIIGTAHRYFSIFSKIAKHFPTAVIIHNQNFTKLSRFQLLQNIFKKDTQYRLKLLLKEGLLVANNIYRRAQKLFVLDESLKTSNFEFLPVFYNKSNVETKNEVLKIAIPGAVDQQRRDYQSVLEKLKNFTIPAQIVFLGKAAGKELQWLQNFSSKNINVKFFTQKVSQEVFDREVKTADVLWCPVQRTTEFFSNAEFYGATKMSGNIGDAIKYGKLAVFPRKFVTSYPFIINEEDDLQQQFLSLKSKLETFRNFEHKNVKRQLESKLSEIL